MEISLEIITNLSPSICRQDTSRDPEGWTKENPLYGHDDLIAILVWQELGGTILRSKARSKLHEREICYYHNLLADEKTKVDVAFKQFRGVYELSDARPYLNELGELVDQEELEEYRKIITRYWKFAKRFLDAVLVLDQK